MAGVTELAWTFDSRRRAADLALAATAARGKSEDINKRIREWSQ